MTELHHIFLNKTVWVWKEKFIGRLISIHGDVNWPLRWFNTIRLLFFFVTLKLRSLRTIHNRIIDENHNLTTLPLEILTNEWVSVELQEEEVIMCQILSFYKNAINAGALSTLDRPCSQIYSNWIKIIISSNIRFSRFFGKLIYQNHPKLKMFYIFYIYR